MSGGVVAGGWVLVHINQAMRQGWVLASLPDGRLLVEYTMPLGTTALVELRGADHIIRGIPYRSVPLYWLRAIIETGTGSWRGRPQGGGNPPQPDVLLRARTSRGRRGNL